MMYTVHCKKCGQDSKLDVGEMTREEVKKWLDIDGDGFHCFGNHVEFCARSRYWKIDWNNPIEGNSPTEEEFLADLKSKYSIVLDTTELQNQYDEINFQYALCLATEKKTKNRMMFDFVHSPKGKRYYIA